MQRYQADVIVVGAGLAGLVAAVEAADRGRSVLLLDQEGPQSLGGQAFWSLGGLFMVDTPEQRRMKIRDSRELAAQDWYGSAGFARAEDANPRAVAEAYLGFAAGEMRDWRAGLGMRWFPVVGWAERGGALAHGLKGGRTVPDAAMLERLVTQPRRWRKVVMDVACAAPEADILAMPYERLGSRPETVLGYAVNGRFAAPTNFRLNGLAQVPQLPERREVLRDRGATVETLPEGMGRWHPFDAFKVDILREIYVEDLAWLRAGADGMAYLIEEKAPEQAGTSSRFG
jgi:hypothetical protein